MESLFHWLQALPQSCTNARSLGAAADIADGIVFEAILKTASPQDFEGLNLNANAGENRFLRGTNLKKIVRALEDFFTMRFGAAPSQFATLDANAAGRDADPAHLAILTQLILIAALQSDRTATREIFVEGILGLDENDQSALMVATQDVLGQFDTAGSQVSGTPQKATPDPAAVSTPDTEPQPSLSTPSSLPPAGASTAATPEVVSTGANAHLYEMGSKSVEPSSRKAPRSDISYALQEDIRQLETVRAEYAVLSQKHAELEMQCGRLARENEALSADKAELSARLSSALDSKLSSSKDVLSAEEEDRDKEQRQHLQEVAHLKNSLEARDASIADLRRQFALLETANRMLRDEVDVLRPRADDADRLSEALDKARRRLEESREHGVRVKELEAQCEAHVQRQVELEAEASEARLVRQRVDGLKKQIAELTLTKGSVQAELEGALAEIKRREEALEAMRSEQLKLRSEAAVLRAGPSTAGDGANPTADAASVSVAESLSTASAAEVDRLRAETAALRKQVASLREGTARADDLQDQLDLAREMQRSLEDEKKHLIMANMELKSSSGSGTSGANPAAMAGGLSADSSSKLRQLEEEKADLQARLNVLQERYRANKEAGLSSTADHLEAKHAMEENASLRRRLEEAEKRLRDFDAREKLLAKENRESMSRFLKLFYELGTEFERTRPADAASVLQQSADDQTTRQPVSWLGMKRSILNAKREGI